MLGIAHLAQPAPPRADRDPRALDSVRGLVFSRARDQSRTLAWLSRYIGKWDGYLHEFIWRGQPRRLDEAARRKLATVLDLSEDDLWLDQHGNPRPAMALAPASRSPATEGVPTFVDREAIDAPPAPRDGLAFGLWITTPRGRLRPGDCAYFERRVIPRPGDTAAIIRDRQLAAIGEVEQADMESVCIKVDGEPLRFRMDQCRTFKLASIHVP